MNIPDDSNRYPLNEASHMNNNIETVRYLIEVANADISKLDDFRQSEITWACALKCYTIVQYLMRERKFDINVAESNGNTPLINITVNERLDLDILKYMVENLKADINTSNIKGQTPLMCSYKNFQAIQYFIDEHKADVNACDNDGETLLMYVCAGGNFTTFQYLIEACKAGTRAISNDGRTVLMHAMCNENAVTLVKYLIEVCKADTSAISNDGRTILMHAMKNNKFALVITKYLVENYRVNVNLQDSEGETALMHAIKHNRQSEAAKFLIEHCEADVNSKDNNGKTALMKNGKGRYLMRLLLPHSNLSEFSSDYFCQLYKDARNIAYRSGLRPMCIYKLAIQERENERKYAFFSMFTLGIKFDIDITKNEANSKMIVNDPTEVRAFPQMFDSNRKDSLFDIHLGVEIWKFAVDYIDKTKFPF